MTQQIVELARPKLARPFARRVSDTATLVLMVFLSACSKDPERAKREFVASGDQYVAEEKLVEASLEYRNAIQVDERYGEARFKLANVYFQLHEYPNAHREYMNAAELLPDDAGAQMKAAEAALFSSEFERALVFADRSLALEPKSVDALILRGNALAGLKNFDAAVAEMENALVLAPDRNFLHSNLGVLEAARGNQTQAEKAFRASILAEPTSALAHLSLANFLWAAGRPAEAEKSLKDALAIDTTDVLPNRALAVFYIASNRAAEAEPFLVTVARVSNENRGRLALADYYRIMGRPAEAEPILTGLSADETLSLPANLRLASIALADGRLDASRSLVDQMLLKAPDSAEVMIAQAELELAERHFDRSLKSAERAATLDPQSAAAQFALGRARSAHKDWRGAISAFNRAATLSPRTLQTRIALAVAHLAAGEVSLATQHAREAVKIGPVNADARLVLGRALLAGGDAAGAAPHIALLTESLPNSADVAALVGMMHTLKANPRAARQSFERALAIDSTTLDALTGITGLDVAAGNPGAAVERIERLLPSATDPRLLNLAARTYLAAGDGHGAERSFRRAIEVDSSNLEAFVGLGRLLAVQGRLDQARLEFERLSLERPVDVTVHTIIGMLLEAQNRTAEAAARYRKALALDADAGVAANNLAWLYAEAGENLDEALQLALAAKRRLPESPEVSDTLGWVYIRRGLPTLALAPLRESVAAKPTNAEFHYHLGVALAAAGDAANAKRSFEQALTLRPATVTDQSVKAALARLAVE